MIEWQSLVCGLVTVRVGFLLVIGSIILLCGASDGLQLCLNDGIFFHKNGRKVIGENRECSFRISE